MKVMIAAGLSMIVLALAGWGVGNAMESRERQQDRIVCVDRFEQVGITFDQCLRARR